MSIVPKVLLVLILLFIGILGLSSLFIRMPEFNNRENTGIAKADMRSLAVSIDQYFTDYHQLPEPVRRQLDFERKSNQEKLNGIDLTFVPQFTTGTVLLDAFSIHKELPYAYYRGENRYVLFSPGSDEQYQLTHELFLQLHDVNIPANILNITYDPTNGTFSPGDIYHYTELKNEKTTARHPVAARDQPELADRAERD